MASRSDRRLLIEENFVGTPSAEVEQFLTDLKHPLKEGVLRLRAAILASDLAITERVKWNAPSFCYEGEDRVTFRLQPPGRLQLIFHRGAKARADSASFVYDDPTGLLTWLAPDRAMIDFPDLGTINTQQAQVVALVEGWMLA